MINLTDITSSLISFVFEQFGGFELTEIMARPDAADVDFKLDGCNYCLSLRHDTYKDKQEAKDNDEQA